MISQADCSSISKEAMNVLKPVGEQISGPKRELEYESESLQLSAWRMSGVSKDRLDKEQVD